MLKEQTLTDPFLLNPEPLLPPREPAWKPTIWIGNMLNMTYPILLCLWKSYMVMYEVSNFNASLGSAATWISGISDQRISMYTSWIRIQASQNIDAQQKFNSSKECHGHFRGPDSEVSHFLGRKKTQSFNHPRCRDLRLASICENWRPWRVESRWNLICWWIIVIISTLFQPKFIITNNHY